MLPIIFFFGNLHSYTSVKGIPDFLVLGITKCGTSSLYQDMIQHPKILGAKKKELHFFDNDTRYAKNGIAWYVEQFPHKNTENDLIGEASPGYFWKQKCLRRIIQHCPRTKFIVSLRNPIKRVISEYFRRKRRGEEKLPFDQAIRQPQKFEYYLGAGCYSEHLKRWFSCVPRNQIHLMFLEDMATDPKLEMNKVFKFLGLQKHTLHSYKHKKKANYNLAEISPQTIEKLKRFYEPFNRELEKMLGRKLPW